jgi:hypothetical protein
MTNEDLIGKKYLFKYEDQELIGVIDVIHEDGESVLMFVEGENINTPDEIYLIEKTSLILEILD